MVQIFCVLIMNNKTLPVTSECNLSNIQKTKKGAAVKHFPGSLLWINILLGNYKDFKCWSAMLAPFPSAFYFQRLIFQH